MANQDQNEAELEKTRRVVAETVAEQSADADAALETEDAEESETDWDMYTKEELVEELRARGLPVSGSKDDLVARLNEEG
jgi:hypothetical protein